MYIQNNIHRPSYQLVSLDKINLKKEIQNFINKVSSFITIKWKRCWLIKKYGYQFYHYHHYLLLFLNYTCIVQRQFSYKCSEKVLVSNSNMVEQTNHIIHYNVFVFTAYSIHTQTFPYSNKVWDVIKTAIRIFQIWFTECIWS